MIVLEQGASKESVSEEREEAGKCRKSVSGEGEEGDEAGKVSHQKRREMAQLHLAEEVRSLLEISR